MPINTITYENPNNAIEMELHMKAATAIVAGEMVSMETVAISMGAKPAVAGANNVFMGIAIENSDNTAGMMGAKKIKVRCPEIIKIPVALPVNNAVGLNAYIATSTTVNTSGTVDENMVGKIIGKDANSYTILVKRQNGV